MAMKAGSVFLALALAGAVPATQAQTAKWPDKPVRVVIPFAPGGSTDIIARVLTAKLAQEFGQQFIVDNRAGAGGSIGADIVMRANPDGYTVIIVATSYATNAALYKLNYDPVKDIAPVGRLHQGPFLLTVNNSVQARTVKEFIDMLRAKPGGYIYGSSGIGGATHLATELFSQMTKTKMVHVPYKGDAPAVADLLGGQIQFIFSSVPGVITHVRAGRVRALAVTTEKRFRELPDLPAIAETVPDYEHTSWNGMWAPRGTPKDILAKLNAALGRILQQPETQDRLRADGREPAPSSPEEFARVISKEIGKWKTVVKNGNIKVQ
jgi:tripartite-type tricarboxylate transporter receptor subunit TctC